MIVKPRKYTINQIRAVMNPDIAFYFRKHTFSIAQDPMDWEVSLISMFLSSITSFLWIWRNEQLRKFAETGVKKIISKMDPLYQVNI